MVRKVDPLPIPVAREEDHEHGKETPESARLVVDPKEIENAQDRNQIIVQLCFFQNTASSRAP